LFLLCAAKQSRISQIFLRGGTVHFEDLRGDGLRTATTSNSIAWEASPNAASACATEHCACCVHHTPARRKHVRHRAQKHIHLALDEPELTALERRAV